MAARASQLSFGDYRPDGSPWSCERCSVRVSLETAYIAYGVRYLLLYETRGPLDGVIRVFSRQKYGLPGVYCRECSGKIGAAFTRDEPERWCPGDQVLDDRRRH